MEEKKRLPERAPRTRVPRLWLLQLRPDQVHGSPLRGTHSDRRLDFFIAPLVVCFSLVHVKRPLLRSNRADHASSVLRGGGFDLAEFHKIRDDLVHDFSTFLDMSHFPSPKDNRHLDFILLLQELDGSFDLEFDVVLARLRPQSDLFGLDLMGAMARSLFLFVFVLAKIHDSTHGRTLVWCDLDQIQLGFLCSIQSLVGRHDSQLLALFRDHPDWRNTDLIVDPVLDAFDRSHPFL